MMCLRTSAISTDKLRKHHSLKDNRSAILYDRVGVGTFMEIAKPVTLIFCILSLYTVFYTAFLDPASDLDQRICESPGLLPLAAGVSAASALVFREATQAPCAGSARLTATLPMQMFCWAAGAMFILFIVSLYLESHCIFYRDVRFF